MNTNKMTMIERLIEGYERAKKPIAYTVMVLVVLLGSLPSDLLSSNIREISFSAVLLVMALILMGILFELYEATVKENRHINQINSNDLYEKILGIVSNEKKVSINLLVSQGVLTDSK